MNKILTALLALALSIPVLAFAQNSTQNDNKKAQEEANQAAALSDEGVNTQPQHTMMGTVSDNGKQFTSGDTTYVVDNPKKLKDYDGKSASIEFQFNTEQNTLHILKVSPGQSQP